MKAKLKKAQGNKVLDLRPVAVGSLGTDLIMLLLLLLLLLPADNNLWIVSPFLLLILRDLHHRHRGLEGGHPPRLRRQVELLQLPLAEVVDQAGADRVAEDVDRGTEPEI